jgi:hypothetical protein
MARAPQAAISQSQAIITDIAVGVVAGLAAAGAMHLFQMAWAKAVEPPSGTPATAKAADKLSEGARGKRISKGHRQIASNGVHYFTGALLGAAYGLIAGLQPVLTTGRGLLFGVGTWLVGDELAVPALGLSPPPSDVDAKLHAYGALSHAVFGLALDHVRRHLNERIAQARLSQQD